MWQNRTTMGSTYLNSFFGLSLEAIRSPLPLSPPFHHFLYSPLFNFFTFQTILSKKKSFFQRFLINAWKFWRLKIFQCHRQIEVPLLRCTPSTDSIHSVWRVLRWSPQQGMGGGDFPRCRLTDPPLTFIYVHPKSIFVFHWWDFPR